ncbi:MAG TPA: hypothetical protein VHB79_16080 [Polyangiaceae bacterium]|nr:hypothetical protein [Polyangiaceae bacterium]
MTFALLGSLAIGCGGAASNGTSGNGSGSGQPPNNASDPTPNTGSGDQAPTSSDQAPTNSDKPPASSETPAGTGNSLGALCRRFCDELTGAATRCSNDLEVTGCDGPDACQVPPEIIPCADEIGDFIGCAIDNLALVCPMATDNNGPGNNTGGTSGSAPLPQQQTSPCTDSLKRYTDCAKAHGIGDDDNMMTGGMPMGCYPAGGCKMCANDCATCTCQAGADQDKLVACVQDTEICPPPTP